MGSGFSTLTENISLEFDKNGSMVYQSNEVVSGKVKLLNDIGFDLKLKNIIIELVGEIVYITSRGSGQSKTKDIHVSPFFIERQIVRTAQQANSFVLEPGNHVWPFSFRLTDSLPSTLEQTRYQGPYVRYVVRIQLIRSDWYKRNIQKACFITVQSVLSPIPATENKDDNKNIKSVYLNAILQKNIIVIGEKLILRLDLHNQNRAQITRVSLKLIQERLLGPAGKETITLLKKDLEGIHDFQEEHLHDKFEFRLPEKIVPSCSYVTSQWSARKPLVVRYELHVEAHVNGLCNNIHLQLPFTVISSTQRISDNVPPVSSYENHLIFGTKQ